jgi:hypothetical protein
MTKGTPAEIYLQSADSIETLRSRLKAIAREHADRIHKLTCLQRKIVASRHGAQGLPGMDALSIDPALETLLANPTHGL